MRPENDFGYMIFKLDLKGENDPAMAKAGAILFQVVETGVDASQGAYKDASVRKLLLCWGN
jgi:hypothetical protein